MILMEDDHNLHWIWQSVLTCAEYSTSIRIAAALPWEKGTLITFSAVGLWQPQY